MRADRTTLPDDQPPRRPRGRPALEHVSEDVLEAAYTLCATVGLKGATIQAIADASGITKMTIYKRWPNRLPLLIDAFLRQTVKTLPIALDGPAKEAIRAHAVRYARALQGDLGRVQLAVIAECMAETGSSALFVERYLNVRRRLGVEVIQRGQAAGEIRAARPAEQLYDQIYGTIFYRYQFGFKGLTKAAIEALVDDAL